MKLRQARKIVLSCGHHMCRERCCHKISTLITAMLRIGRAQTKALQAFRRSHAQ